MTYTQTDRQTQPFIVKDTFQSTNLSNRNTENGSEKKLEKGFTLTLLQDLH